MLKVALTHDVDRTVKTYQYFTHTLRAIKKGDFKTATYHVASWHKRRDVYWNFDEIIDIETKHGVKSTFFFLIESLPFLLFKPATWKLSLGRYDITENRIRQIIKELQQNDFEVGLHGSYASYNDLSLLKSEKQQLEAVTGQAAAGIRQHYLNLNENTWQLQQQAGFIYDSSWGYTRKIGFKDGKAKPFHPFKESPFTVFPLAVMDSCYMHTPNRRKELEKTIEQCIENNAVLVVNWHNNNFNEKDFPGWKDAYKEVIEVCMGYEARTGVLNSFLNQSIQDESTLKCFTGK